MSASSVYSNQRETVGGALVFFIVDHIDQDMLEGNKE